MSHSKPIQQALQDAVQPELLALVDARKIAVRDVADAIGWQRSSLMAMYRRTQSWGVDFSARIAVALGLAVRITIRRSGTTVTVERDEELDHEVVSDMAAKAVEL